MCKRRGEMPKPSAQNGKSHIRSERRRSARICCSGLVEGVSDQPGHLFRGEIRSVSEAGCFISTRASVKLPRGACVQLRLKLGRVEYSALARVVEALPCCGIRMQFIATDPAFTERMRYILSANADGQT